MLKLADNPGVIFPDGSQVGELEGTWWVAHTKSRQEKAFAHDLARREVPYFLPLFEKTTVIRGRRFRPLVPLFTSYVFVCCHPERRLELFDGRRLAGTIPVADQTKLVGELAQIQKALQAQTTFDPWPYLQPGRRCRVIAGPLRGVEGVLQQRRKITRLILTVHTLGQAVAAEIDAGLVELVD